MKSFKKILALTMALLVMSSAFAVNAFAAEFEDYYETPVFMYGDVDFDSRVSVKDSTAIQKYLAKIITLCEDSIFYGDVDGNEKLSISDATLIQKFVAKMIDVFPAEAPAPDYSGNADGKVLELDRKGARFNGTVPAGRVLIDGSGIGDIGSIVLRDRKILSEDGLVVVVAAVDVKGSYIVSGPDIVSRGFVYVKESEELMEEARRIAEAALSHSISRRYEDRMAVKANIKDELAKFIFKKTKRRPMILPIIMEV